MHEIPELDRKGLREFALVTGAILVGLFGLLLPWIFDLKWPLWPWILAAVLVSIGLAAPLVLRPVYRTWMRFGLILSRITTPIFLALVFFLMITPMGLVRRIVSSDPMARNYNDGHTYRVKSEKRTPKSMERPF